MRLVKILAGLTALLIAAPAAAGQPRVKLTTMEWPPFSGPTLQDGGVTVAAARSAFAAVGWALDVEYLPWRRAVEDARVGAGGALGYFPAILDSTFPPFTYSQPIGSSLLGLAEHVDRPFAWSRIDDLAALGPIGVVNGYVNSREFDAAVRRGALKVELVSEDVLNLKKLASGRIRAAVIDHDVMAHLLKNDPSLAAAASQLSFNSRPLTAHIFHVAFRDSPEADAARVALNRGMASLATTPAPVLAQR